MMIVLESFNTPFISLLAEAGHKDSNYSNPFVTMSLTTELKKKVDCGSYECQSILFDTR